ncbi:MAG: rod shape-determining protein MreC [Actinomycetales bacterium]|nr:MAG: rod shape-determining protein MreC [Actinomycetales bacterium]
MAAGGNNRTRLLLVILIVTSLFLITLDLRGVNLTSKTRSVSQSFLAPIQRGFSDFFSPVGNFFGDVKNFGKTKSELTSLQIENRKLKSQLILNSDTKGELAKLKGVLNLAGRGGYKVVSARVIGRGSTSTFSQTITIDAGTSEGITKDMTVMSESGIVGSIKTVTSTTAIVLLMSDPTFRIGVRIAGTQSVGVLLGQGNNRYTLQLLDPAGTIKYGDALISLGSDNNRPFVAGLPVGYVASVDHSSASLTQSASVVGYSNLLSLGVVSVITQAAKGEIRDALVPVPDPTQTVYVTSPAVAPVIISTAPTPDPTPLPSKLKK